MKFRSNLILVSIITASSILLNAIKKQIANVTTALAVAQDDLKIEHKVVSDLYDVLKAPDLAR